MVDSNVLFQQALSKLDRKRKHLKDQSAKIKKDLDLDWDILNYEDVEVIDGDTVRDKRTNEVIRVNKGKGKSVDAYESNPYRYDNDPDLERQHKKAYGEAIGMNPRFVRRKDLLEKGAMQKQDLDTYLRQASEQGGIELQRDGYDVHGRSVGTLTGPQDMQGRQSDFSREQSDIYNNPGYWGQFNGEQRLSDIHGNQENAPDIVGKGPRPWKKTVTDQGTNILHGAGQLANSLLQAGAIGLGQGEETADFFDQNRQALGRYKNRNASPQQLRRERMAQRYREKIQEPKFQQRQQEYMAQGKTAGEAKLLAVLWNTWHITLAAYWMPPLNHCLQWQVWQVWAQWQSLVPSARYPKGY